MAFVAAVATVAGAGLTAYGQYQSGKAQERAHKYNAAVQRQQAQKEEWASQYEAELRLEKGQKILARQRTQFAKTGGALAGTPLLVLEETAENIAQDVAMTRYGGRERAGYYRSQAGLSLQYGRSARRAGVIGAGTSLLSGASTAAYRYRTMMR